MARTVGSPEAQKMKHSGLYCSSTCSRRDRFDKYIEKNIHNPEPETIGQQVVVVSFIVHTDGSTIGIKILRSPGQACPTKP